MSNLFNSKIQDNVNFQRRESGSIIYSEHAAVVVMAVSSVFSWTMNSLYYLHTEPVCIIRKNLENKLCNSLNINNCQIHTLLSCFRLKLFIFEFISIILNYELNSL